MKPALFLVAAITAPALASSAAVEKEEFRLTPRDIGRLEQRDGGAGTSGVAGIRTLVLAGNPAKEGPYSIELRVPAHTQIAAHTHRDYRSAVVVSGTWYFGYGNSASAEATKPLPRGSFYTELAGDAYFAVTQAQPVTVIISGTGPTDTRYVGQRTP